LREEGEVRALRQILSQQAIGVFVLAALPRAMGMGEVNLDAGIFSQFRMLCHFTTLIVSERAAQLQIEALQDRTKPCCRCLRIGSPARSAMDKTIATAVAQTMAVRFLSGSVRFIVREIKVE
jgi:hypothetical protein